MKYDVYFSSRSEQDSAKAALNRSGVEIDKEYNNKFRTGEMSVQQLTKLQARFHGRIEPVSEANLLLWLKPQQANKVARRPASFAKRAL